MLSRIAESLYWIGRYTARADGTSRILDVQLQLLLEDAWVDEDTACRALLSVMGAHADPTSPLARQTVLTLLGVDRTQPTSIAYALTAARENARRAREVVNTELWECLNATKMRMPRKVPLERAHEFFSWVRERVALVYGVLDSSTSRDQAWQFFTLGTSLERADMAARLLATRQLTEASGPSWTTILRSCGGYEAYLRTYRGTPSAIRAAEFLLMDRLFPRSILFSIARAEECLRDLEPRTERAGVADSALRVLGQMRSQLEYLPVDQVIRDLPTYMESVQAATSVASDEIRQRYFPVNPVPSWAGDAS